MPEEIPGADWHPYDSPKELEKRTPNKTYAKQFWKLIQHPKNDRKNNLAGNISESKTSPENVINLFNSFKQNLLDERDKSPTIMPFSAKKLEEFSLYDVYLWALWDTNRSAYYGIPPNERPNKDIAITSEKEQKLSLLEEAMDLAGHRPKDTPKDYPK